MRRLRATQSAAVVAGLAVAAAASLPAVASAQSGVNPAASVLPLVIENAILPINVRDAVLPLEDVQTRGTRTRVTLAADVLFAFNQAKLTPAARRTIARIGRRLRDSHGVVQVEGYTDSVGTDAYNLRSRNAAREQLSRRCGRARAAASASPRGATGSRGRSRRTRTAPRTTRPGGPRTGG